ncbi:MAG: hypothetical protein WC879_00795 [Melioribacteraceae bacterium]
MKKIDSITNSKQNEAAGNYKLSNSLLYLYSLLGIIFLVMILGMAYFLYFIFK